LSQTITTTTISTQTKLSLNIRNIDELFPGFEAGDFSVLHGTGTILPLSLLLCVRAQLPSQLGGLGTDVVFIDGSNTFRLYKVSRIAELHQLNPRQVLERIQIARAFTAYQMASLIMDKLEAAVNRTGAKLVVISDIAELFLDEDLPDEEAKAIFSHVIQHLSTFAKQKQVVLLATYFPNKLSHRNLHLKTLTCQNANVVACVRKGKHGREFVLEKHPRSILGYVEFPSENPPLSEFMGGQP